MTTVLTWAPRVARLCRSFLVCHTRNLVLCAALLASCGRVNFDALPAADDAGMLTDARLADAAQPSLGPEQILDLGPGSQNNPMSIWQQQRLLVAWKERINGTDSVQVASFDENGQLLDGPFALSGPLRSDDPWLAASDNGVGAIWAEGDTDASAQVFFRLLSATGESMQAPIALSTLGSVIFSPTIAWTGQEFVVVWREDSIVGRRLFAATIDSNGNVLSPAHRLTQENPSSENQSNPEVRNFGGSAHLVWLQGGVIHRGDLSAAGEISFSETIEVSNFSPRTPTIAGNQSEFAVAYHDDRTGLTRTYINFAGTQEFEVDSTALQGSDEIAIAKADEGSTYALVWDAEKTSGIDGHTKYALATPGDGILFTGNLTQIPHPASAHPSVVWANGAYLSVWEGKILNEAEHLFFRRIVP